MISLAPTRDLPERGRIGVFNRSHYEEVLIARVHPEILRAERLSLPLHETTIWHDRYRSITGLERHLHTNGTRILNFSSTCRRTSSASASFAGSTSPRRIANSMPEIWKSGKYWDAYMNTYENCLAATSTNYAPWYVVPADDKKNTRLIVSRIIVKTLRDLGMHYPQTSPERQRELLSMRERLAHGSA